MKKEHIIREEQTFRSFTSSVPVLWLSCATGFVENMGLGIEFEWKEKDCVWGGSCRQKKMDKRQLFKGAIDFWRAEGSKRKTKGPELG